MSKLINICMNYSGMREPLTDAEIATVLDTINTEFKILKPDEVLKAFRMNATGKYWKPVIAYQLFSPPYVSEVLGNYKEWIRKENLKPKRIEASHHLENKINPEHEQKRAYEFIKKVFEETGAPPLVANYSDAFKYCEKENLINLSIEEKKNLFNEVKNREKRNINERRSNGHNVSALISLNLNPKTISVECQKICVLRLFE